MKTFNCAKMGFYIGSGSGLILFVLAGLLPSAYFAGALGVKIETSIFGYSPGILAGFVMVLGVLLAGLSYAAGIAFTGWLGGTLIDAMIRVIAARMAEYTAMVSGRWLIVNAAILVLIAVIVSPNGLNGVSYDDFTRFPW